MIDDMPLESFLARARKVCLEGGATVHILTLPSGAEHRLWRDKELIYMSLNTRSAGGLFAGYEQVIADNHVPVWHCRFHGRESFDTLSPRETKQHSLAVLSRGRQQLYDKNKILGESQLTEQGYTYHDTKLLGSGMHKCVGTETLSHVDFPTPLWTMHYEGSRILY